MNTFQLILYTRKECCLCKGLEDRLRKISLNDLSPPLELDLIDIDDLDASDELKLRYDMEVPVMVLWSKKNNKAIMKFPRVSPRLNDQGLFLWLQQALSKIHISV